MASSIRVQDLIKQFTVHVNRVARRNAHATVCATMRSLPSGSKNRRRSAIDTRSGILQQAIKSEDSHWRTTAFLRTESRRRSSTTLGVVNRPGAHEDDIREVPDEMQGREEGPEFESMASLQEILGIKDEEAARLRSKDGATRVMSAPSWKRLVTAGAGQQSLAWFLVHHLKADPNKVRVAAFRYPTVLFGKSSTAALEMLKYFEEVLGMDRATIIRVFLRFPQCARLNVETVEPKVRWLRENICADYGGVARIISLTPQILGRSIEEALEPQLMWLQVRFKLPAIKAAGILRTVPVLFTCCPERNLEHVTQWLKDRVNLDDSDIAVMVTAAPTILTMNPASGIEPKLVWLRDQVGLSEEEVRKVVRVCPQILKRSIANSLEPKLAWLRETLRLSESEVKMLLLRCPNVTGASLDGNLRQKLPWLTSAIGLTQEEAVKLLSRNPGVLLLSIGNNLEPTIEFYREHMGASEDDLQRAIMQNPRLLATSLKGRLMPRAAAMRARGIKLRFKEHQSHVGVLSDAKFDASRGPSGSGLFVIPVLSEAGSSRYSLSVRSLQLSFLGQVDVPVLDRGPRVEGHVYLMPASQGKLLYSLREEVHVVVEGARENRFDRFIAVNVKGASRRRRSPEVCFDETERRVTFSMAKQLLGHMHTGPPGSSSQAERGAPRGISTYFGGLELRVYGNFRKARLENDTSCLLYWSEERQDEGNLIPVLMRHFM